jgi:hypothetical protein
MIRVQALGIELRGFPFLSNLEIRFEILWGIWFVAEGFGQPRFFEYTRLWLVCREVGGQ